MAYFTNMTLRAKKYLKLKDLFWYLLGFCSIGRVILSPTESPSALAAPRLAASIIPPPPPVIMVKPASERSCATSTVNL